MRILTVELIAQNKKENDMNDIDNCYEADEPTKHRRSFWIGVKRFIMWRGYLYRIIMRIAHKFNWHYAPPIYPDGDTQLWCKWCGFRRTIKRKNDVSKLGT